MGTAILKVQISDIETLSRECNLVMDFKAKKTIIHIFFDNIIILINEMISKNRDMFSI